MYWRPRRIGARSWLWPRRTGFRHLRSCRRFAYFDGYRAAVLPANLLQGQRDYFGAHTYERVHQPRGKFFHLDRPEADRPQLEIQ